MKKLLTIMSVLILVLVNSCSGGGSGGGDDGGGGGNGGTGVFPLTEISNPPALGEDESIEYVVNSQTIIKYNDNNEKHYLLTYYGNEWIEEELSDDTIYPAYINETTFMITDESRESTLYININGKWQKHSYLQNKVLSPYGENVIEEKTQSGSNLWVFQNNAWELIIENILYLDCRDNTCIFRKSDGYAFGEYKNNQWHMVIDFQPEYLGFTDPFIIDAGTSIWAYNNGSWQEMPEFSKAVGISENTILVGSDSNTYYTSLYEYKNGEWQEHSDLKNGELTNHITYIYNNKNNEYYIYKDKEWQLYEKLADFKANNADKAFVQYINEDTVLIEDTSTPSIKLLLYNYSLTKQYSVNETYNFINEFNLVNNNTILFYSDDDNEYIILEYDGVAKQWEKTNSMENKYPYTFKGNGFIIFNGDELWGYDDDSWKVILTGYYYALHYDSFIAYKSNPLLKDLLYVYNNNKWNKVFEADEIYGLSDTAVISIENEELIKIWCFDGTDWKISHTFNNASLGRNFISTSDGKLYYSHELVQRGPLG